METYINAKKHFPSIPSAHEVEKVKINVAEMDAKLLQKIEELSTAINHSSYSTITKAPQ